MSLFDALRDAGLTVRADPGWESRGDDWREGQPIALMMHHTAPPVPFPIDRLNGSDGKLKCNINTKPDGTVWLIALRACNYSSGSGSSVVLDEARAGTPPDQNASQRGLRDDTNGNPYFWNFENDHPGDGSPIPQVQLEAIVTATRVCLDYFDLGAGNVISHAEWTARKVDPYWNGSYRAIEEIRNSIGDDMPTPREIWDTPAQPGSQEAGFVLLDSRFKAGQALAVAKSILKAVNQIDQIDSQALAQDIAAELQAEGVAQGDIDELLDAMADRLAD